MRIKKMIAAIGLVVVMATTSSGNVFGETLTDDTGNMSYPGYVTDDMCEAAYWQNLCNIDPNKVLMDSQKIIETNTAALEESSTCMYDLENMEETFDATSSTNSLAGESIPTSTYYINGEVIDNTEYFGNIFTSISNTGLQGIQPIKYGVCTKRADMKAYPTKDILGYSANDTDDEIQSAAVMVNEPVVVKNIVTVNDEMFYYCYSSNCSGWVPADSIAICQSKDEWLDAWKVEVGNTDFLVVTQDQITLEKSISRPEISETKLTLGCILKLVPVDAVPTLLDDSRSPWFNYVVYVPARDENGNYKKMMSLIPKHYDVNVGFAPLTQANVLEVAFSCLGNRYGWGGMLDSMDCSMYTRNIYRCFGLELPRNTTWQQNVPGLKTDVSGMDDAEKQAFLESIPAGSLLYFKGHTMVYIGSEAGVGYVISDVGNMVDTDDTTARSVMSVAINPLTVKRGTGTTWLSNLIGVVTFSDERAGVSSMVSYKTQIQSIGWEEAYVSNGTTSGTVGKTLRLEGIKIKLSNNGNLQGGIQYRTHIQKQGWETEYACDDELSGTEGKALRLEAIQIRLTGDYATNYDVYYRVQAQKFGWLGWAKNDEQAGTAGFGYRLEGIQIVLVNKGEEAPTDCDGVEDSDKAAFYDKTQIPVINYRTQVQKTGWESNFVSDGAISGTVGKGLRLEAIQIKIADNKGVSGGVSYRTHVQSQGWQSYVSDGAISGTVGKALRLEAIQIKLTGDLAKKFDIYYRVQAQKFGWLGWAKNGIEAGSAGYGYRLEAIQIMLGYKDTFEPVAIGNSFKAK